MVLGGRFDLVWRGMYVDSRKGFAYGKEFDVFFFDMPFLRCGFSLRGAVHVDEGVVYTPLSMAQLLELGKHLPYSTLPPGIVLRRHNGHVTNGFVRLRTSSSSMRNEPNFTCRHGYHLPCRYSVEAPTRSMYGFQWGSVYVVFTFI